MLLAEGVVTSQISRFAGLGHRVLTPVSVPVGFTFKSMIRRRSNQAFKSLKLRAFNHRLVSIKASSIHSLIVKKHTHPRTHTRTPHTGRRRSVVSPAGGCARGVPYGCWCRTWRWRGIHAYFHLSSMCTYFSAQALATH